MDTSDYNRTAFGLFVERPSPVADSVRAGDIFITTDVVPQQFFIVRLNSVGIREWMELQPPITENVELLPIPEGQVAANSTRVAQTTFEGASYVLRRRVTFDRILLRITARAGAPTMRMLIYQGVLGGAGIASLIATVSTFAVPAPTTNFEVTPAEGIVTAEAGLIYVLWGRDSGAGSFTLRTYTVQADDLLTANVDAAYHPTSFTTAVSAATSPATFNPTEGGDANATATDVTVTLRLRRV